MFIIGELINGMYKDVRNAIQSKDKAPIQKLAMAQLNAGANALDVNVGPTSIDPKFTMKWLVETIREVCDLPLAIDSTKPNVVEQGVESAGAGSIINSTSADDERLNTLLPLAKKYNAKLIGLTMDKDGIPKDRAKRAQLGFKIITSCLDYGLSLGDVYIDPIILPINVAQTQCIEVLEAIRELRLVSDPPPNTILGLSNVSQGTKKRPLINRTCLVMAVANGLTAAILDPLDTQLMEALITAELLLNKNIYCDSYIDAYRKK